METFSACPQTPAFRRLPSDACPQRLRHTTTSLTAYNSIAYAIKTKEAQVRQLAAWSTFKHLKSDKYTQAK